MNCDAPSAIELKYRVRAGGAASERMSVKIVGWASRFRRGVGRHYGDGFAAESDARVADAELLPWLLTWFLHTFAAALYEISLSADMRFFMQLAICTIV
jgi:hypothetical protein